MSRQFVFQNPSMKTRAVFALPWILALSCGLAVAQETPLDYASWETANGITGAGADVDSDGDGISNGIEFAIGGDPSGPGSDSNSLLPTVTVDANYLNFTFRRTDDAAAYNPFVEYSSSLGAWVMADPGENGILTEEDVGGEVVLVTVRIPRILASGSRFFARLHVNITP
jgi:hypothetical protein